MDEILKGLHDRVVGIRQDGSRAARYENLSQATSEQIKDIMVTSRFHSEVAIEDQKKDKRRPKP